MPQPVDAETSAPAKRPRSAGDDTGAATVQSFHRGLMILELIITANRPLRLAEIARTMAIDKASIGRAHV